MAVARKGRTGETPPRRRAIRGVTFEAVCECALQLPGVEMGTSYGTPALKVRGKLIVRLKEDGESFVLRVDPELRELMLRADPEVFYLTDHYRDYPCVLVRLAALDRAVLPDLLDRAWHEVAPKTLVKARSGGT